MFLSYESVRMSYAKITSRNVSSEGNMLPQKTKKGLEKLFFNKSKPTYLDVNVYFSHPALNSTIIFSQIK